MYDTQQNGQIPEAATHQSYLQADVQAKIHADKDYYGMAAQGMGTSPIRYTMRKEMELRQESEQRESSLRGEAIDFLRDNPAFDQFIALIRKGAIRI